MTISPPSSDPASPDPAAPDPAAPDPAASGLTAPDRPGAAIPAVSVLISVRNGMPYVESAVRSIMEQTFSDIEIIVVNDGSTDDTAAVLDRLATEDPRIRIVTRAKAEGLAAALNAGLAAARAPYLARMDADDIAVPHRLAVQKAYLDAHPEVLLIGASNRKIDREGRVLRTELRGLAPFEVRWRARFNTPLVHPTLMFRRYGEDGGGFLRYDPAAGIADDYDYLVRTLEQGEVASLPDVLLDWRVHATSMTATRLAEQKADTVKCALRMQALDLPEALRRDLAAFTDIIFRDRPVTVPDVIASFGVFRRMLRADARTFGPEKAAALWQQAVTILVFHLGSRGIGRRRVIALMALFAPDFLLAGFGERRKRQKLRNARVAA